MNDLTEVLVEQRDGVPMASSLVVAEKFDKEHKNVLRAIERLEAPEEFRRLNFEPSSYVNSQGKEQRMYWMTWEGFSFLVMRFTGSKAAAWQLKFISEFKRLATRQDVTEYASLSSRIKKWAQEVEDLEKAADAASGLDRKNRLLTDRLAGTNDRMAAMERLIARIAKEEEGRAKQGWARHKALERDIANLGKQPDLMSRPDAENVTQFRAIKKDDGSDEEVF